MARHTCTSSRAEVGLRPGVTWCDNSQVMERFNVSSDMLPRVIALDAFGAKSIYRGKLTVRGLVDFLEGLRHPDASDVTFA